MLGCLAPVMGTQGWAVFAAIRYKDKKMILVKLDYFQVLD